MKFSELYPAVGFFSQKKQKEWKPEVKSWGRYVKNGGSKKPQYHFKKNVWTEFKCSVCKNYFIGKKERKVCTKKCWDTRGPETK